MTRYFRRHEAAHYLTHTLGVPCALNTLNKYATTGGGPKFHKSGRIPLYTKDDLDAWASERVSARSYSSTSDARHAA